MEPRTYNGMIEKDGRHYMHCPSDKCNGIEREYKGATRQNEHYQSMIGTRTSYWTMECIECGHRTDIDFERNAGR